MRVDSSGGGRGRGRRGVEQRLRGEETCDDGVDLRSELSADERQWGSKGRREEDGPGGGDDDGTNLLLAQLLLAAQQLLQHGNDKGQRLSRAGDRLKASAYIFLCSSRSLDGESSS